MLARTLLLSFVAASFAAAAAAQPMMDPRRASGVPRPESGDPAGQLTVRVLQGALKTDEFGNSGAAFPAGQVVHLVAVKSDGTVALMSKPVDQSGRAVFAGLATDGGAAYYAMTVLARDQVEDRLRSRPITMPPQVGMRLILAGHAPDSTEPGVDDLLAPQMPTAGPGEVLVGLEGRTGPVNEVRLVELGSKQVHKQAAAAQGQNRGQRLEKSVHYTGLAAGVYVAETIVDGRVYRSEPVQLTASLGAQAWVWVYPQLLLGFHMGGEADDDKLWFQVQFTLANYSGAPFTPGPDGIRIPLPKGFVGASVRDEDQLLVRVDPDSGFIWRGPLPPGERSFIGQFALPVKDGDVDMAMDMPFGALQGQVMLRANPGLSGAVEACVSRQADGVTDERRRSEVALRCMHQEGAKYASTAQGAGLRVSNLEGAAFLVIPGLTLPVGDVLRIRFSGLPVPPGWWRPARITVGAVVVLLLAVAVAGLFSRRQSAAVAADARTAEMTIERDELYEQLIRLETNHRAGRVKDRAYERSRAQLKRKLTAIQHELGGRE
jgi:hypothetical protein